MEMANNKKGGGIGSRQHKSVGVRTGTPRPRGQNPKWTSQIGSSLGNHASATKAHDRALAMCFEGANDLDREVGKLVGVEVVKI
jgi:hypothetical protein